VDILESDIIKPTQCGICLSQSQRTQQDFLVIGPNRFLQERPRLLDRLN
jgi:hypothetical protein